MVYASVLDRIVRSLPTCPCSLLWQRGLVGGRKCDGKFGKVRSESGGEQLDNPFFKSTPSRSLCKSLEKVQHATYLN